MNALEREAATIFKERLQILCPGQVASVRVYGSRARGDARAESDLDVLVLTSGPDGPVRRLASEAVFEAYRVLDYPFPISPQVMTQDHFDELLRRERLFARSVLEEGVLI